MREVDCRRMASYRTNILKQVVLPGLSAALIQGDDPGMQISAKIMRILLEQHLADLQKGEIWTNTNIAEAASQGWALLKESEGYRPVLLKGESKVFSFRNEADLAEYIISFLNAPPTGPQLFSKAALLVDREATPTVDEEILARQAIHQDGLHVISSATMTIMQAALYGELIKDSGYQGTVTDLIAGASEIVSRCRLYCERWFEQRFGADHTPSPRPQP